MGQISVLAKCQELATDEQPAFPASLIRETNFPQTNYDVENERFLCMAAIRLQHSETCQH